MYPTGSQEVQNSHRHAPTFYARPSGTPWPAAHNDQMRMSGHQLVYYPVRTICPVSGPNSVSMASYQKQNMYRPVAVNPSGGFCQCPRPCPVPLERFQLPLCNNCMGNQSHVSPYVAIQAQAPSTNVSPAYPHSSAFHYQADNFSVQEPRPFSARPTMITPLLVSSNNSKNAPEANVVSVQPVTSIPPVSSSVRRTETTDQLQQYPSQVYIGGLLQPTMSQTSNAHFASDKLSMEFVAHEPAEEQEEVVQTMPESLTNGSHGIHITANAHIRFQLSIPMFTPNTTNDGITEEPVIGVSNMPVSLPLNLHARARNQQSSTSSTVTSKQQEVFIDTTRAHNDNELSLATSNPVEHNTPSRLIIENIRQSSKNPQESATKEKPAEPFTTPPTESQPPHNSASITLATPTDSFQVYPENWVPNSTADLAGVEEVTTITREVSLMLEQESHKQSHASSPMIEDAPQSQTSIPSLQLAASKSAEPGSETEQTSTKVSILPEHLRRLLSDENQSLTEKSPPKQSSVSVIKAPEKQPTFQPSVSIFHPIHADPKPNEKMVTRASQAKSHHKTHSSPTVKKKFSSVRQNKGYSKSNSSAYKSKSKGHSKHHLRRSVKTFKTRRGKATEPGQGTHNHNPDPNALEIPHLASNNEYRKVRTAEHLTFRDTVAAYDSGILLPNAPLSIIAPLHISLHTTQESLQIKPTPQITIPNPQNREPSKKSNAHGLPSCQTPSGHKNNPPCNEPRSQRLLEEKGTSTERSRKTQTAKQKIHKPELEASTTNPEETKKSPSHDNTQTTFILCPRCCPKLTATSHQYDTKCGTWPVMDNSYFSTSPSPHSNDKCVKNYTKALHSLRGDPHPIATQKSLVQQKKIARKEGRRRHYDYCNSLNLCCPGLNGCYEEFEHWILEPELLAMSYHSSQSKVQNNDEKEFYKVPRLRNLDPNPNSDRTSISSEYLVLSPQDFGRPHFGRNSHKTKAGMQPLNVKGL